MSDASRCPVCDGRGEMPAGFYTAGVEQPETCRSCGGRGFVVVESAAVRYGEDVLDLTYRSDR